MVEMSSNLPPQSREDRIESVLQQDSTYDAYRDLLSQAGIADASESLLSLCVRSLVDGNSTPEDFFETLAEEFHVSQRGALLIAKGVGERVLAPFEKDLPFALRDLMRDPSILPPLASGGIGRDDTDTPEAHKLEEELEDIKQQKAAILETKGPLDIPGIVKEICENSVFKFEDAQLQERCAKLIESRVRDVRTPEQTRAQLEKAVENGGLGVTGRRLSDMLAMIEGRVAAFQGNLSQEERRKRIEKRAGVPDKETLAKKEESLLTKRYAELTGKVPNEHVAPAAPNVSRTSVAISAQHEQLSREGKIDSAKVKAAVVGAQQVVAPRPRMTPRMQEVTFEKRLSGPIDELRSLSLTDFRRLSKDPIQASTKVKDKVDLLEEQGYEKKVEAIQAWRGSPLNQMYVEITREAVLTGVPVVEILGKKRTAGEETLTDEELKAVMKLNADLRF
ncbi:hypothetical protein HY630_02240 [Candidatus Uhrbacteria bacterium]|nr:hypothetical protein [Candidatus Uhrbacteria bacterium]